MATQGKFSKTKERKKESKLKETINLKELSILAQFSEEGTVSNSSEYSFVVTATQPIVRAKLYDAEHSTTDTEGAMHAFAIR